MHSECFTGDLLGSLRCDCGPQLQEALRLLGVAGHGVLLYLAHEGRGIGLVNKLRAYQLQDLGLDTVDANQHLGFEPDERTYGAAAVMLRHLGIERVRLLTNNPAKVEALVRRGHRGGRADPARDRTEPSQSRLPDHQGEPQRTPVLGGGQKGRRSMNNDDPLHRAFGGLVVAW